MNKDCRKGNTQNRMAINKLKPTPALYGAAAARFKTLADENKKKSVSREEAERIMRIYSNISKK